MGANTSTLTQLSKNEQLNRFVSTEPLEPNHPFWNGMLSYQLKSPRTKSDWQQLERNIEELAKRFVGNNLKTGNFGSLLRVFLARQAELSSAATETLDSSVFVWQTFNALFILRVATKFFIERLTEDEVYRQFEAQPSAPAAAAAVTSRAPEADAPLDEDTAENQDGAEIAAAMSDVDRTSAAAASGGSCAALEDFVTSLIDLLLNLPLKDLTYGIHLEAVTALLVLASFPLFSQTPAARTRTLRCLLASKRAPQLTKFLLDNFIAQSEAPAGFFPSEGGSLVLGLASGMWSVLTLGYGSWSASPAPQPQLSASGQVGQQPSRRPLADACLLMVLVLTNHCTDGGGGGGGDGDGGGSAAGAAAELGRKNPYRAAVSTCANALDKSDLSVPTEATASSVIKVDFPQLFKTLCSSLSSDEATLLLYLLLHQNESFKSYLLASSDMELMIVPILKTLYRAPESNNHHIYMSLIELLILSEDDLFNKSVHDFPLRDIHWYTERSLGEISLGGLIVLIVIRTIQYNMLKMRDKYLHTNCLAALANMSSQFRSLHPYVCQRIISMFEALAKKHNRLINILQQAGDLEDIDDDSPLNEALSDAAVLEEVLKMILEIINSCLTTQIVNNPNLIYTLLYKRQLFEPYVTHPAFKELVQNLQNVIIFFNSRLEQIAEKNGSSLGVHEVQDIIRQSVMQFPREKLTKFPELKFKYVEEDEPEDFFVPYVWTLATYHIYWDPNYIKLFAIDEEP